MYYYDLYSPFSHERLCVYIGQLLFSHAKDIQLSNFLWIINSIYIMCCIKFDFLSIYRCLVLYLIIAYNILMLQCSVQLISFVLQVLKSESVILNAALSGKPPSLTSIFDVAAYKQKYTWSLAGKTIYHRICACGLG